MPRTQPTTESTSASEEAALLLAGAPTPMPTNPERDVEVAQKEQHGGGNVGDPESIDALLSVMAEAIGRPELAALVKEKLAAPAIVKTEAERRAEAQERLVKKALEAQGKSIKQANMLAAIKASPMIVYFCKKERSLMLNQVTIKVPAGRVVIPKLVAEEIDHMDAHDQWAEGERLFIEQTGQIPNGQRRPRRTDSFAPRPIERFQIIT